MKLSAGVSVRVPNLAYPAGQTLGLSRKTSGTAGLSAGWQAKACPTFLLFGWLAVSTAGAAVPRYAFSVPAGESPNAVACRVKAGGGVLRGGVSGRGEEFPAGFFREQRGAGGAAREGASIYL